MTRNFKFLCPNRVSVSTPLLSEIGFGPSDLPYDCCDLVVEFLQENMHNGGLKSGLTQEEFKRRYDHTFIRGHINSTYHYRRVDHFAKLKQRSKAWEDAKSRLLRQESTSTQNTVISLIQRNLCEDIYDFFMDDKKALARAHIILSERFAPIVRASLIPGIRNKNLFSNAKRFDLSAASIAHKITEYILSLGLYDVSDNGFQYQLRTMRGLVDELMPDTTTVPLHNAINMSDLDSVSYDLVFDGNTWKDIDQNHLKYLQISIPFTRLFSHPTLFDDLTSLKQAGYKMLNILLPKWRRDDSYRHTLDILNLDGKSLRVSVLNSLFKYSPFDEHSHIYINRVTIFRRAVTVGVPRLS